MNNTCLACGSPNILPALDLGNQPLANSYLKANDEPEDTYPLGVNLCHHCFHLQLTTVVDPSIIYKNYLYVSGTTKTLKDYSNWFASYVDEWTHGKRVLDIGCNDGTQLDSFKSLGYDTWGIDPAENIYPTSSKNHTIVCDFFREEALSKLKGLYDAITAQNVMAHNPNPLQFLLNCRELMGQDTKLFVQTSQANLVLNDEFDTIYHEHVNYFNISSMNKLAKRAGLHLIDAIRTPIHGTSYVFVFSRTEGRQFNIQNAMSTEAALQHPQTYVDWVSKVNSNMDQLKVYLHGFKQQGYQIVGYGAAAKGNTLLNYLNFKLDLIIDDNPLKQNLYTPGQRILIRGPDAIREFSPEDRIVFMPLAWNFFTEIRTRIKKERDVPTDVFLKYFPKVTT
jgi:2-polyprenyl-3-methyl-5-hydroxy-6-metoxy-1,4-benzoquinol methylase